MWRWSPGVHWLGFGGVRAAGQRRYTGVAMEVRLLGPVEVHADTGQLPVRGPIQRALVALLALHANRVVTSQELLGSLWGPGSRAVRRNLQWQVWQLRRLLGPHADRLVYRAPRVPAARGAGRAGPGAVPGPGRPGP